MNFPPSTQAAQEARQQALADALALHRSGKRELAMQRYVALLADDPTDTDALYYVAVLAVQEGQVAEGMRVIQRALAVGPPQARLHNLMGQAQLRLRQPNDALLSFERAIVVDPEFADAYGNRANLLADMGRRDEALEAYDLALALRPDNAEDLCNRATVLADLDRLGEALAGYDRAIALRPDLADAHHHRAELLRRLGRMAEALAGYDQAIALRPAMVAALSNRGAALKQLGRLQEAAASIDRALELQPDFPQALANRGNIAFELGHLDKAKADYARAAGQQPGLVEADYGHALICLTQGDWETGFRLYEVRGKLPAAPYRPLPYQRWDGEPLREERLVLLCEQGLSDTIHFCRFAPLLAERGIDVTLLASEPMQPLLSSLKGVTVATAADAPTPNGRPLRWLPLMSAPRALNIRPSGVPANVPYLAAEPARIDAWRRRIGAEGFKIGLNWAAGAARNVFARRRDIPLSAFAPLAAIPGVRLIALQKGEAANEIAATGFGSRIETFDADPDPGANLFLDTAAVMRSIDLVVTCDTSVAHLAGALAIPVFTALPIAADWRWLLDRDDSPWYPTMRLFRQRQPQRWDDVLERIAAAVAAMMKS